jgi:hypothetical protein
MKNIFWCVLVSIIVSACATAGKNVSGFEAGNRLREQAVREETILQDMKLKESDYYAQIQNQGIQPFISGFEAGSRLQEQAVREETLRREQAVREETLKALRREQAVREETMIQDTKLKDLVILKNLKELKDSGVITEEEFQSQKKQLLEKP